VQAEALEPGRARPKRDSALQRGGNGLGEQRHLGRERVAPLGLLGEPPAARQEPSHAAMHAHQERRDVGIGGWRQSVEAWPSGRARARVDAVGEQLELGAPEAPKPGTEFAGAHEIVRQRRETALRLAADRGTVRSGELAAACGIAAELARQTLGALVDPGLLCRVEAGRGTRYQTARRSAS
jgi:hypothetical protein